MIEKILFETEARQSLMKGIELLAKAVMTTYGCAGRNVITGGRFPRSTRDGVSVAKSIVFADENLNQGASILRQAALETLETAGDGTSLSTLLAYNIILSAEKYLAEGANPNELKKGIDYAVTEILKQLDSQMLPCDTNEKIKHVATISANNDEFIGGIVAEAYSKIGDSGLITLKNSTTGKTYVEHMTGMQVPSGFVSPYFVNTEKFTCELNKVAVILVAQPLEKIAGQIGTETEKEKGLLGILDRCARAEISVLIVCKEIEGEVMGSLHANKKTMPSCAVRAPYHGIMQKEMLEDIASVTGATVLDIEKGLDVNEMLWEHVGYCDKVVVERDKTLIVGGLGDPKKRAEVLKSEYELTKDEVLRKRLAYLSGGVAVIHVWGETEVEQKETLDRVDDAYKACRVAIEGGVVEGGGVAMLRCNEIPMDGSWTENEIKGGAVILGCMSRPIEQILRNAGIDEEKTNAIKWKINQDEVGYNARTGQYENFFETGVIDPLVVIKTALKNAASVAGTLILTGAVLINSDK